MLQARRKGARGPIKNLYKRPDRDALFMDLIRYYIQRSTAPIEGEDRITLEKISDKYRISVRTLQGYIPDVELMVREVKECASLVGLTHLDVVSAHRRYQQEVDDLLTEAKERDNLELRYKILEGMYPTMLERLALIAGAPREEEPGKQAAVAGALVSPITLNMINAINGKGDEGNGQVRIVEAQREVGTAQRTVDPPLVEAG